MAPARAHTAPLGAKLTPRQPAPDHPASNARHCSATTASRKRGSGPTLGRATGPPRANPLRIDIKHPQRRGNPRRTGAPPRRHMAEERLVHTVGGRDRQDLAAIAENLDSGTAVMRQHRRANGVRLRKHEAESLGDDEVRKERAQRRPHFARCIRACGCGPRYSTPSMRTDLRILYPGLPTTSRRSGICRRIARKASSVNFSPLLGDEKNTSLLYRPVSRRAPAHRRSGCRWCGSASPRSAWCEARPRPHAAASPTRRRSSPSSSRSRSAVEASQPARFEPGLS